MYRYPVSYIFVITAYSTRRKFNKEQFGIEHIKSVPSVTSKLEITMIKICYFLFSKTFFYSSFLLLILFFLFLSNLPLFLHSYFSSFFSFFPFYLLCFPFSFLIFYFIIYFSFLSFLLVCFLFLFLPISLSYYHEINFIIRLELKQRRLKID